MNGGNYLPPARARWAQPARWVTIGFLAAVFFAPWGPVPRYAGWAVSAIALLILFCRGQWRGPVLDRRAAWILAVLLVSGGITTAVMKQDPYFWAKGFSLLAEFAFSIWLAAWVLIHEKNGTVIWVRTWYAGTAAFVLWGAVQFLRDPGGEILFSNVNSLGLYACLIMPLLLGAALRPGARSLPVMTGQAGLVAMGGMLLLLSFSLTAWVAGALQVGLFFLFLPAARKKLVALLAGSALLGTILLVSMTDSSSTGLQDSFSREIRQLRTLILQEPAALHSSTRVRLDLVRSAVRLGSERPLFGWGWGRFDLGSEAAAGHDSEALPSGLFAGNAHSMYFNLWVMGGILALTGICLVHGLGVIRLAGKIRCGHELEITIPAMILIISMLLYSLGGDVFDFRYKAAVLFWSVLGFACRRDGVNSGP